MTKPSDVLPDVRQEFESALGKGLRVSDLSPACLMTIQNAVPFARTGHDDYLRALAVGRPWLASEREPDGS